LWMGNQLLSIGMPGANRGSKQHREREQGMQAPVGG